MGHCGREEAIVAKEMAIEKLEKKDYINARKYAQIAHKFCPDLDNIIQMILVCDVHCCADEKICGNEMDWYKIMQIDKTADDASIKKQYNKLALGLHPDKNRFPGAADAFQVVCDAKRVLLDREKRRWYDYICQAEVFGDDGFSEVRKKDDDVGGSKRGRKRRGGYGSVKVSRKKRASKKGNVVEDNGEGMDDGVFELEIDEEEDIRGSKFSRKAQENDGDSNDDEVQVVGRGKKSKNSSTFDISAQEVDKKNKRKAKVPSKTREKGKRVEGAKKNKGEAKVASKTRRKGKKVEDDAYDIELEIDRGVRKSRCTRSSNTCAQEVEKRSKREAKVASKIQEKGKRVEDDAADDIVEIDHGGEKSKSAKSSDVCAQEVDENSLKEAKVATKAQEIKKMVEDNADDMELEIHPELRKSKCASSYDVCAQDDNENSKREAKVARKPKKNRKIVQDNADCMEVEIDPGLKKLKCARSSDACAQEVDKKRKRKGKVDSKPQENHKMVEDNADDMELEIHAGLQKSKCASSSDVCVQEVDKNSKREAKIDSEPQKNKKMVEDNADDVEVDIHPGLQRSNSIQEVHKKSKREAKVASKPRENKKIVDDNADNTEVEIDPGLKKSKSAKSPNVCVQEVDKQCNFSKTQENKKGCVDKSLPNTKTGGKSTMPSWISPDSKILEYSAPEFNEFDEERHKMCFGPGQIWATYDTLDAMPRFYCLINKVISQDFKLRITWLEPYPNNMNERRWLHQGLPTSCGEFKLGFTDIITDHAIFSHLVNWKKRVNLPKIYQVHPRKGETWALFKNWDFKWYQNPDNHKVYEFEFVEILSDHMDDVDFGVSVTFLHKINGFTSVFSRVNECVEVVIKDRYRLSHRVPSVLMNCEEGLDGIERFFELDPASLGSH